MSETKQNIGIPLLKLFALLLLGIIVSSFIQYNILGKQTQEDSINKTPILYLITLGIFQLSAFLLPALFWLKHIDLRVQFSNTTHTSASRVLKMILLFIAVFLAANAINALTQHLIAQYAPDFYATLHEEALLFFNLFKQKQTLWLSVFVVGVIPAVCEEFFFRAGIFGYLEQKTGSFWHSAILSSIFFAGVHFQLSQFIPIFILGVTLAAAYHYTRSIWVPIILHMVNNTVQIITIHKGMDWF